jgi:hypothetical protein
VRAEHRVLERLAPIGARVGTDACPGRGAGGRPMTATEHLLVGAADEHDAEQGYPWRWEVMYGGARRTGACQTRAQAEREGATVLELLRAA